MKKQNLAISFCLFFISVNLFSAEWLKEKQEILNYVGANSLFTAACGVGAYVAYSCNIPEEFYVKNNYPYAQVWYDEIAKKYPMAHFEQRKFLQARRGILHNDVTWEATFNQIYAHKGDLQRIDEIYKKKSANEVISEEDVIILNICEFLLLHEAAHVNNNDSAYRLIAAGTIFPILEIAQMSYTGKVPSLLPWSNSIDQFIPFIIGMIVYYNYLYHQEARADRFACDHAQDIEVLQGGLQLFNYITTTGLGTFDFEHPNSETRAQKVVDEINRRLANKTLD